MQDYNNFPKESRHKDVKRTLESRTLVWYSRGHIELAGYSADDHVGYKVDRKSTPDTCQFLGQSLVSWHFKKQNSITLSIQKLNILL